MANLFFLKFQDQFLYKPLLTELKIPQEGNWTSNIVDVSSVLTKQAQEYLNKIQIYPSQECRIFVGAPNSKMAIHIDDWREPGISDFHYAINFVWGSTNSSMSWYSIRNNQQGSLQHVNPTVQYNRTTVFFSDDQVDLLDQVVTPVNRLFLTRIDIPHSVINHSDQYRLCLSIRADPKLDWDKIINYLTTEIQDYVM